jgi:hypothetical protein
MHMGGTFKMDMSISGVNPMISAAETQPKPVDIAAPATVTVPPKDETVEISKSAQARLLQHQGQTVAQIAINLGLDAKTVDSYLG